MKTIANNLGKIIGFAIGTYIAVTNGPATAGTVMADLFLPITIGHGVDVMWSTVNTKKAA